MKNNFAVSMLAATGLIGLVSGCASTHPLTTQQAALAKEQVNAPGIFAENCATCHGKDGRAKTFHGRILGAQNFTDSRWQATNEEIISAIKTGPNAMPAFENKLSPAEIESLAIYVCTFKPVR